MSGLLLAVIFVPFVASAACWLVPDRAARAVTVTAGAATLGLAVALVPAVVDHPEVSSGKYVRADALSTVFLLATAFLYATTALFAVGYLHVGAVDRRYRRRFWAGLNLFAWSMAVAPLVNGLALLWVAVEITTVISALLVALDDTDESTEAAWKYVLIASMGLGIALLATVVMYYAGSTVFGSAYDLTYASLLREAHRFPPDVVRLAYLLAVLGFGTKMGLVPVHTWLPDAHSEAPTPVSALLSGSLLAVSFYAILRYYQITARAVGGAFPRDVLLGFGIASLSLAALYLASQRDLKRLLAYSSIEHMGVLTIGMSFAAPLAVVGVLLHVLAHAAAKGTAFFGAGSVVRKLGTKDMATIRGGIDLLPWTGPMLVLAVLGLSALPPFGIFRSEFLMVSGGLSAGSTAAAALLVIGVTVAFAGLAWFSTRTMMSPASSLATPASVATPPAPTMGGRAIGDPEPAGYDIATAARYRPDEHIKAGETNAMMTAAMVIGLVALAVLGVHPPGQLSDLLQHAANQLGPYS